MYIPALRAITDKKLTPPINLKATPIAKTATAINNIVAIPFLIPLWFFSFVVSIGLLSLLLLISVCIPCNTELCFLIKSVCTSIFLEFSLVISKIVSCLRETSETLCFNSSIPTFISPITLEKSPPVRALATSDLAEALSLSDSAICSNAKERLLKASNKRTSILIIIDYNK